MVQNNVQSERPRRVNGLSPPYTAAQITTWVLLPLLILEFGFFATPLLPLFAGIPCFVILILLGIVSAYNGYQTMKVDPSDPRLLLSFKKNGGNNDDGNGDDNGDDDENKIDNSEETKHCWICDVQVNEKSMHCKFCNKCIDHFDHHCMWMNTCVGKKNYKYFYKTLVNIIGLLLIHFFVQLVVVLDLFLDFGNAQRLSEESWFGIGESATLPITVVIIIFLVSDGVTLSLMFQLWFFHLRLQKQGLTTYQYIVQDNRKRRERQTTEQELNRKRNSEMQKALAEKRKSDYYRLYMGGKCTKCIPCLDPLKQQQQQQQQQSKQHLEEEEQHNFNGTKQSEEP